jgi:hypothetical protein
LTSKSWAQKASELALIEGAPINTELGVIKHIPKGPSNNLQKIAETAARKVMLRKLSLVSWVIVSGWFADASFVSSAMRGR